MDDGNYNVHDDYDNCDIMLMVMKLTMMMMMFTMSNTRMIAVITMVMFNYELVRYS